MKKKNFVLKEYGLKFDQHCEAVRENESSDQYQAHSNANLPTENEKQLFNYFQLFISEYDLKVLEECPVPFSELTDNGILLLFKYNFFGLFGNIFKTLRTIPNVIRGLKFALYFSGISSLISHQLYGSICSFLLSFLSSPHVELYDHVLQIILNFSQFPEISESIIENDILMREIIQIFFNSSNQNQATLILIIQIATKLSKISSIRNDDFINMIISERVPFAETIGLLHNIAIKTSFIEERFANEVFIHRIITTLIEEVKNENAKHVSRLLKFINVRCGFTTEARLYFQYGDFLLILLNMPAVFMIDVCRIFLWFFSKISAQMEANVIDLLYQRISFMIENGNFREKEAAANVLSKIVSRYPKIANGQLIIPTFELILAGEPTSAKRILDLFILITSREKAAETYVITPLLLENNLEGILKEAAKFDNLIERVNILHGIICHPIEQIDV